MMGVYGRKLREGSYDKHGSYRCPAFAATCPSPEPTSQCSEATELTLTVATVRWLSDEVLESGQGGKLSSYEIDTTGNQLAPSQAD